MTKGLKRTTKSILAWVLAVAMTFANVEPVSAAVVVESIENAAETSVETASVNEVSAGTVSESEVSGNDASTGDATGGDASGNDVSGNDVTTGDVTSGDVTTGDVTNGDVTDGNVSDGDVSEGDLNILASGEWHGIIWKLTQAGVLSIEGEDTNTEAEYVHHWEVPWYNYRESVVEVVVTARNVKSTQSWFRSCTNLSVVDFSGFDTSQVTEMRSMFSDCSSLEQLDLNEWDVSNVTEMSNMFSYCLKLKQLDLSKWDVRNVANMQSMFLDCNALTQLDLSKWNMSSVANMYNMFKDCRRLEEVKLGKANSGTLQDLSYMFSGCLQLKKVRFGKINTSNVTNMEYMFNYCQALESVNVGGFDTGNVTSMESMFESCEKLTKLDVKGFKTGKVENMKSMFKYCKNLTSLDVSGFDTSNVTTMQYMFTGCESLTKLDVSGFDTDKVTNMASMFSDCFKVKELDVTGFNTANVTAMDHMFFDCASLTELDFSGFDTSKAEKMAGMANGCDALGRIKVFVNLQQQVSLPQAYGMWDLENNYYEDYYPTGLTESFWLYFDPPEALGNMWVKEIAPQVYTGKAIKPEILVYNGYELLTEKTDYTISYKNNTKANDATNAKTAPSVVIKGKGNYSKQDVVTFQILPRDLDDKDISAYAIGKKANGKVQKPVPVVTYNGKKLANKKDFTVSYPDLEDENIVDAYKAPGTYRILVTGKGNFTGEKEILFTITEGTLMSKVKIAAIPDQEYTSLEICPEVTVTCGKETLVKDTDYTVSYEKNIEVGKATVIVTGMGNKYAGAKTATFKITGTSIAKAKVSGVTDLSYSGSPLTQEFTVEVDGVEEPLVEGQDYTVKYTNNVKPGKATITITGIGRYTGTVKKTFKVNKLDLGQTGWSSRIVNGAPYPEGYDDWCVWYSKGTTKLKFEYIKIGDVYLVEGKDYTLSYVNDIRKITAPDEVKQPRVRIKGKGYYTGVLEIIYNIVPSDLSSDRNLVTMTIPDVIYSEKPGKFMVKPVLTDYNGKKLSAGTDYDNQNIKYYLEDGTELTKDDVVEAGQTIRVTVTGKGNYTGVKEGTYHVMKADIKKAKFQITPQVYTGYNIWPYGYDFEVAKHDGVDLTYDVDYEVKSVKNNLKKGTATVTIHGLGNYGGTKTVKFKIVAKEMIWFWKMFD